MINATGQTASGSVTLHGRTLRDIEEHADAHGCLRYVLWGEVFRKLAGEWVCVGEAATGTTGKGDRRSASRFRKHNAHALAEERSDDSQQRVVGGKVDR
jgi:hypothetical protein